MVHVTELQAIFVHARVAAPQCTCASLDHLRSAFNRAKRRLEPRCAHICASRWLTPDEGASDPAIFSVLGRLKSPLRRARRP